MTQCPVIRDLLPLYVDDALSPESRTLVAEHLGGCPGCRQVLDGLRSSVPSVAMPIVGAPSDDARWLTRLKRQVGTAVGLVLVLLIATPLVTIAFIGWRNERAIDREVQAQIAAENAAVAAIAASSPDPLARLRSRGVSITTAARNDGTRVEIDYTLSGSGQVEVAYAFTHGFVAIPRLIDPATGNVIGRYTSAGYRRNPGAPIIGQITFEGVTSLPAGVQVQFPYLMVYLKAEQELKWEIERPGKVVDVPLGQRFTIAGVEFAVERIRFTENGADIDYRQLTPASEVGVHLLNFRLSDRMGGSWNVEPLRSQLPDLANPSQHFDFVASLSKSWVVQVEHAVLALPGPILPLEVQ